MHDAGGSESTLVHFQALAKAFATVYVHKDSKHRFPRILERIYKQSNSVSASWRHGGRTGHISRLLYNYFIDPRGVGICVFAVLKKLCSHMQVKWVEMSTLIGI